MRNESDTCNSIRKFLHACHLVVNIPRSSVLRRGHSIRLALARRNWTFLMFIRSWFYEYNLAVTHSNTWYPILTVSVPHPHSVPVNGSSIMFKLVVDSDLDCVSPIGVYCRARILPIHCKDWPDEAIRS